MANTTLRQAFSDIADAIRAKGVTGTMTPLEMPTKIGEIPSGGGDAVEWKDVNFIDYDGTLLKSYTAQEALQLTTWPTPPDRTDEGLVFQGWTRTLASMKEMVQAMGKCDMGATYATFDNKTHIFITIPDVSCRSVYLHFNQTIANGVSIDWGDGSESQTVEGTGRVYIQHSYPSVETNYPHSYEITMSVLNGEGDLSFQGVLLTANSSDSTDESAGASAWQSMIDKIFLATDNVSYMYLGGSKLLNLNNRIMGGGHEAYGMSGGVKFLAGRFFRNCADVERVAYQQFPPTFKKINDSAFMGCKSLREFIFPHDTDAILPDAFNGCSSLTSVTLPDSVRFIYDRAFYECFGLTNITFGSGIQSIGQNAFYHCYGLASMDFSKATAIPSLNSNSFSGVSLGNRTFWVPLDLIYEWKAATNWINMTNYITSKDAGLRLTATVPNSTVQLNQVGHPTAIYLEHKINDGEWLPYTVGDVITLPNVGDYVIMRSTGSGTIPLGNDADNYHQFSMTGGISADGALIFMVRGTNNGTNWNSAFNVVSGNSYCFYKLFSGCTALVQAPKLGPRPNFSSSTLQPGEYCFAYMFEGCTGLTSYSTTGTTTTTWSLVPSAYKGMFKGCTGLTNVEFGCAATLPATHNCDGCFEETFDGCSNLQSLKITYTGNFDTTHFKDWVKGVASTGTLYYNGSDTTVGDYAIPTGWTVQTF